MNRKICYLLIAFAIVMGLYGCIGISDVGPSGRIISGVAMKSDGTTFEDSAIVLATDAKGRTSRTKVKSDGTYMIRISARSFTDDNVLQSAKGNTLLQISDDLESIELIIPDKHDRANVNLITAVASQLLQKKAGVDLEEIFRGVEVSLAEAPHDDGQIVDEEILKKLLLIDNLNKEDFRNNSQIIVGAMFGYDTSGNPAVGFENFLTGSLEAKENILLRAASKTTKNILSATISATNNPENTSFLLNNNKFYEEVGRELADEEGKASTTEFAKFLGIVIESIEIQQNLSVIADELNAFVLAVEPGNDALTLTIPEITVPANIITFSVSRNVDILSFSDDGGLVGDTTIVRIRFQSSAEIDIIIEIHLVYNDTSFEFGTEPIAVTTDEYPTAIVKSTSSISNGSINLATLLAEARAALVEEETSEFYIERIPTSTIDLELIITCTPISRVSNLKVPTFFSTTSTIASSISGVILE